MKIRALNFATGLLFILIPTLTQAEAGWSEYTSIVELTATNQQRFLLQLKAAKSPSGCKNETMFYQDYDTPGADQMLRLLLEAVAADKTIRVFVTGACELKGYSEIASVTIRP